MNLSCETILDFYTHKNRKILCQIKVTPSKSRNNTCRCLTVDEWNKFDKKLEKLITTTDDWNNEKCHTFNIKPYIEVKVQKSKLSLKHFLSCLGAIGDFDNEDTDGKIIREANYVLECLFDFQSQDAVNPYIYEYQKDDPQIEASPDNSLSYEPYTPSKKKYRADNIDTVKTPGIDLLEANEYTSSPKDTDKIAKANPLYSEKIPKYTPASNKVNTRSSRESSKSGQSDLLNEVIVETGDEIESPQKYKSKIKSKYIPESQEFVEIDVPAKFPSLVEETRPRKHKKRCNTIDEIPGLHEEYAKEKCEAIKEQVNSKEKHSHYEKKKLKKRSKSIDERQITFASNFEKSKLKKIVPDESSNKPLESINETKSYKSKEIKKNSNEAISTTKTKDNKKNPEIESFSSSEDEFLAAHKKSKMSSKTQSKASDDEFEDDNKLNKNIKLKESNNNASNLNSSISSATESATDTSPSKGKRGRKSKGSNTTNATITSLRRSERSPNKPARFREDPPSPVKKIKSKKHKTSPTNKELFGTDDDDDDEYFEKNNAEKINNENKKIKSSSMFETPVSKKSHKNASSSSSSSTKKKRKRDKSSECEQEKRTIGKWLSKKNSSPVDKEREKASKEKPKSSSSRSLPLKTSKKDKSRKADVNTEKSRSNSPKPTFEIPSKEEMELMRNKTKLMQKENAIVRAELDKMRTSPPKEVEILSLQNIPVAEILNTFSTYKSELDEIYENNRKRDYIKGHDGINHCFVIRLLQPNIQMKMLEKLTDVYSNTNNTTQATLFANALLPEWVIRVYMEKFKFTRQEAINQIKAQEEFQLHMEEQSDNSFMFD